MVLGSSQHTEKYVLWGIVRRNYGSSRIVNLMDFGEYVKTSRSGVLYCGPNLTFKTTESSKVLFSSLMEKLLLWDLK